MANLDESRERAETRDVLGLAIALLGMKYLEIPLHEWLRLSGPLALAIAVIIMGGFLALVSGHVRGRVRSYSLFIFMLAVGGYGYMKFLAHH